MLNPELTLSAAPELDQEPEGSTAVCERCGEPRAYFVHQPSSECAGGYPCINPGAHHPFNLAPEGELRLLWGDR